MVEDENVDAGQTREQTRGAAVRPGERTLVDEPQHPAAECPVAFAAGLLDRGACEIGLVGTGWPGDPKRVMPLDAGRSRAGARGTIPLPPRRVVDVFDAGLREAKLRLLQRTRQPLVLSIQPLGIDQDPEPLIEAKVAGLGACDGSAHAVAIALR